MSEQDDHELQRLARERRTSFALELLGFLSEHKKWWLLPIVITLLLFGAFVLLSGTAAGPFIYTLF